MCTRTISMQNDSRTSLSYATPSSDSALLNRLETDLDALFADLETFNHVRRRFLRLQQLHRRRDNTTPSPLMERLEASMAAELETGCTAMRAVADRLNGLAEVIVTDAAWAKTQDAWLQTLLEVNSPYIAKLETMLTGYGFSKEEVLWMRMDLASGQYQLHEKVLVNGADDVRTLLAAINDGGQRPDMGGFLILPADQEQANRTEALICRARSTGMTASIYLVILTCIALCLARHRQPVEETGPASSLADPLWLKTWRQA